MSSHLGFALSTTHVTSGSVIGSGLGKKLADVHWSVVGRIVVAWVITLPAAAVVGALATLVASTSTIGLVVVAVLALGGGLGFFFPRGRKPITKDTVNDEQPAGEPVSA